MFYNLISIFLLISTTTAVPNRSPLGKRFEIRGPWNLNTPVHETIMLSSLVGAKTGVEATAIDSAKPEVKEIFRGGFWNDDPMCQLFDDKPDTNWKFSTGFMWTKLFSTAKMWVQGKIDFKNLIGRSHFADLQFLHAMGSEVGEKPSVTHQKIMLWAEVLYKVSIGTLDGKSIISNAPIKAYFTAQSFPSSSSTLFDLFTCSSKFKDADVKRRALGSAFHMLQDSYAKGHTKRTLLNPKDLKPGSQTEFVEGKYAKLGAIENFHCYKGQAKTHAELDHWGVKGKQMDPSKPSSFDPLWGATMAQMQGVKLAAFWKSKTPWDGGVKAFFEDVFTLSPKATDSDNTV